MSKPKAKPNRKPTSGDLMRQVAQQLESTAITLIRDAEAFRHAAGRSKGPASAELRKTVKSVLAGLRSFQKGWTIQEGK